MNRLSRAAVVLLQSAAMAFAASKVAPDVNTNTNALEDVIIQFKNVNLPSAASKYAAYGTIKKFFSSINGIHIALPGRLIGLIALDPAVSYISPNRKSMGAVDISTATVNANLAWSYGYDGTGVGVAVIDSGITAKSDFNAANGASRIVYTQDFIGGNGSDSYGHGTHVAGILGGSGANSIGSIFTRTFKGMAPNVNLIDLRVLDQNGNGQEADVIAAIDQAIALKSTYNIRVINLSLGRRVFESYSLDPLCHAAEAAYKAGIVVVAAAGNYGRDNSLGTNGYGTITAPGNDPYVITVGATNAHGTPSPADDTIATYSSKGPTAIDGLVKPDLVAPGNGVISDLASPLCTLAVNNPLSLISDSAYETGLLGMSSNYFSLSGTSMATPVVSGAVALLLQRQPSLTPDQVKARLMKTARKILPSYMSGFDVLHGVLYMNQADIFTVGAGYLDVFGALANNDYVTQPAMSPSVKFNAQGSAVTMVRDLSVVWGSSVVWGDSVVWGSSMFSGSLNGASVVWGSSVVWGNSTLDGFSVIWGSTVNANIAIQASAYDDGDQN